MSRTAVTLAVATMLLFAGCAGVLPGGGEDQGSGTVSFYVSDQPGAIEEFSHLNVTITRVGFLPANASENQSGNQSWVTRDVEDRTVDLTELQGANASLLGNVSVPAGEYTTTFAYVSEVHGTLESGESVNVKLPSKKLHLNANVTVAEDETVTYVYDVMVTKAGQSGKYVVRPVVNQSGSNQPVKPVGGTS